MKKIAIMFSLLISTLATAEPVTRRSADLYVTDDGSTAYATTNCTQTARHMSSRLIHHRGRDYLVFVDKDGEEEADCQVRVVVRRVRDTSKIAVR